MSRGPTGRASSGGGVRLVPVQDEAGDGVGGDHGCGDEQDDPEDRVTRGRRALWGLAPDEHDQHDDDRQSCRRQPCTCDGDTGSCRYAVRVFRTCHGTLQSICERVIDTIPYCLKSTILSLVGRNKCKNSRKTP